MSDLTKFLRVAHCCRDWPVSPFSPMGRCGYCGERPTMTDKTLDEYLSERRAAQSGASS